MKKINLLIGITVCVIIMLISCGDGIVGSESNHTINHIEWSLGTPEDSTGYVVTNSRLKATGTITNVGDTTITITFYYSVSFYTDSSFTELLGIGSDNYYWDLEPQEIRNWVCHFVPKDEINASDYPNFAVKDIEFYKEIY